MRHDRFDLPLARAAPGRILPWLAGGLIYVTVVMLAIAISADQALLALRERTRLATVTLPRAADGSGKEISAALDALYRIPSVLAATPVSEDELRALITPWLDEAGDDLPLPAMIDVRLDPLAAADPAALRAALRAALPDATVAIAAAAPDRAEGGASLVRAWSGGFVLLALPAGLLAIGAITRLGLRRCRDAVELLRCMGASPGYLAGQLERHALACGLRGGAIGLCLALLTVIALLHGARQAAADAIAIDLRPLDWGLLAGLAAISLLLAVAVVRIAALRWLQSRPWPR